MKGTTKSPIDLIVHFITLDLFERRQTFLNTLERIFWFKQKNFGLFNHKILLLCGRQNDFVQLTNVFSV